MIFHTHTGEGTNRMSLLGDKQVAHIWGGKQVAGVSGDKQDVLIGGQTGCPYWGTNRISLLGDKQIARIGGQTGYLKMFNFGALAVETLAVEIRNNKGVNGIHIGSKWYKWQMTQLYLYKISCSVYSFLALCSGLKINCRKTCFSYWIY